MRLTTPIIISFQHRDRVDALCQQLSKIGIDYIAMYVVFGDGSKFVVSNIYHMLEAFYAERIFSGDFHGNLEVENGKDYFFSHEKIFSTLYFNKQLEERFSVFRTYYIVRKWRDCKIIFGAVHKNKIDKPDIFYKNSIKKFEQFCSDFFIKYMDVIKIVAPYYSRSIILNDPDLARKVITKTFPAPHLTDREIDCLWLGARGKSAEETAIILRIGTSTAKTYRKNIIAKLNCTNIAQAVYEGIKLGIIGVDASFLSNKSFTEQKKNSAIFLPTSFDMFNSELRH